MATNHTENYNLNLWEANDKFVREEFNENSEKLDAAIKAVDTKANTKADQTALNTLTQTVNTKANQTALNTLSQTVNQKAQIVVGTYTGDGAESRTISVGGTPKAVLLFAQDGYTYSYSSTSYSSRLGGLALPGHPAGDRGNNGAAVEIVTGGFKVMYVLNDPIRISSNQNGHVFHYIAFV